MSSRTAEFQGAGVPWRRRLSTRIGLLVLTAMIIASVVVSGVSTHATGQFLKDKVEKEFPLRLTTVAAQVELWYAERMNELLVFAQSQGLIRLLEGSHKRGDDRTELAAFMRDLLTRTPSFEALFILDTEGNPIVWEGPGFDVLKRLSTIAPLTTDSVMVSNAIRSKRRVLQILSKQVVAKNESLGTFYGVLELESLDRIVAASSNPTTQLTLTDAEGNVLSPAARRKPHVHFSRYTVQDAVPTVQYYTVDGTALVGSGTHIDKLNGSLHIEQPYSETFRPVITTITRTLVINSVVIGLLVLLAYLITRAAMKPVSALLQAVRHSEAQQEVITVPEFRDRTEIGALARAFNSMAERLNSKSREVEDANTKLRDQNEQLEELSTTDTLTSLRNRRYFQEQLSALAKQTGRTGSELSLILIDVDRFKQCNDRYGHTRGDEVLVDVARIIKQNTRVTDVAARIGGDEFAILTPGTNRPGAVQVAENIKEAVSRFFEVAESDDGVATVTVSIGVAFANEESESLLEDADRALYSAKNSGRNRVHTVDDGEVPRSSVVSLRSPGGPH